MARFLFFVTVLLVAPTFVLAQDAASTACTPDALAQSQLVGGVEAIVSAADPIDLRAQPSNRLKLVTQLAAGTVVYVVSGPQCNEGKIWWQVKFAPPPSDGSPDFGWAAELNDTSRQLNPRIPSLNPILPHSTVPIDNTILSQLSPLGEMGPLGDVLEFTWSPTSHYLAINTLWGVWIYQVSSSDPLAMPIRLPPVALTFWNQSGAVAFSTDDQMMATVGIPNGDFHLWWLDDGAEQQVLPTQASDYAGVAAIAPGLSKWAIAHADGSISIWDTASGTKLQTLVGHTVVGAMAFTPDSSKLISMGSFPYSSESQKDNSVRIWDVASGQALATLSVNMPPSYTTGQRSCIAISPDGQTATVFAYLDAQGATYPPGVHVIDIPSGTIRQQYTLAGSGAVADTSFNADGKLLAVNYTSSIVFLSADNGTQLFDIPFEHPIHEMAFSPDGHWLAVAQEGDNFNKSIIQFWGLLG